MGASVVAAPQRPASAGSCFREEISRSRMMPTSLLWTSSRCNVRSCSRHPPSPLFGRRQWRSDGIRPLQLASRTSSVSFCVSGAQTQTAKAASCSRTAQPLASVGILEAEGWVARSGPQAYPEDEAELLGEQGAAGGREVGPHGGHQRGVQADEGPQALAGQGQVLGRDGLEARHLHGSGPQHQLAHAAVEHLRSMGSVFLQVVCQNSLRLGGCCPDRVAIVWTCQCGVQELQMAITVWLVKRFTGVGTGRAFSQPGRGGGATLTSSTTLCKASAARLGTASTKCRYFSSSSSSSSSESTTLNSSPPTLSLAASSAAPPFSAAATLQPLASEPEP